MLDFLWSILQLGIVIGGLLFVHELGHYVIGRWVVGIPAAEITIVMLESPQHVVLRDGDEWVRPSEFERYSERYERYDPEYTHLEAYIGAGEIFQTIGVLITVGVLLGIGMPSVAASIVLLSLLLTALYLVFDVGMFVYSGHPAGDYSALWQVSPLAAVAVLLAFLLPHVALYLWL
ncbi:hypothetical protein GS429_16775 [Natronorubrum sp. JWXQ-INN-674]|uniref:Peptidase M50 n=1 Tax=Natronorubrum halalkaliphilum TaxID=2691917 RepID=A0A6B0VRC0_9EURY|nr:hypothetical protein [Natronorubrum halalkaliphilum]MXV63683.1 hypothetical protein [Natronorubrum halalkaliphilum]